MAKRRVLTAHEWDKVFQARCKSKRGLQLTEAERQLVEAAYVSDRKRYAALEPQVFNATVPCGSSRRLPT
jgi:hypothetical protein